VVALINVVGGRFTARLPMFVGICPTTIGWFDWEEFHYVIVSVCWSMPHDHRLVRVGKDLLRRWRVSVVACTTAIGWFDREEILDLEYTPQPWIGSAGKRSWI
jgi:hypothetical protein